MAVLDRISHGTLEQVLRPTRPVAAVYLGAPPAVAHDYQLAWEDRWRPVAEALRLEGADEATAGVLDSALGLAAGSRAAQSLGEVAAFASEGNLLAVVGLPGFDQGDQARFVAPAPVLPLLAWAQRRPAYVLVVADRAGADLEASIGAGATAVRSSVEGPDDEIERNAPGGWQGLTQGRYQRRAEDSWAHNAGAVARAAASALRRAEAKVLVVTGDVRAVQMLRDRLPAWVQHEVDVRLLTGSRARDGSQAMRAEAVARLVGEASELATTRLWRTFLEERSPGGRAVEGAAATLTALAEGRVKTLLVAPELVPDQWVWFGTSPTAVQHAPRPRPGWEGVARGRLVDVAVRSALLTGAQVRVLSPGEQPGEGVAEGLGEGLDESLAGGLGALCRFR